MNIRFLDGQKYIYKTYRDFADIENTSKEYTSET